MSKVKNVLGKIRKYVKENKKKARILMSITTVALILTVIGIANPNLYNKLLGNTAMIESGFEDEVFYQIVIDSYNKSHYGLEKKDSDRLTNDELASITKIQSAGYGKKINSTKGIEKLTGLTYLQLNSYGIKNIDLSKNKLLTTLNLTDNDLTSIELSNNTLLEYLYLSNNKLTSIDLTSCKSLYDSADLYDNNIINIPNLIPGENYNINLDSIKLPDGFEFLIVDYSGNNISSSNGDIIISPNGIVTAHKEGQLSFIIQIKSPSGNLRNIYYGDIYVKEPRIESYTFSIDEINKKIYVSDRYSESEIINSVSTNIGNLKIENNKLKIVRDSITLKEYDIKYVSVEYNKYKVTGEKDGWTSDSPFLYLKADNINTAINNINVTNGFAKIDPEENNLLIYANSCTSNDFGNDPKCGTMNGYEIVSVLSNNYDLNKKYIYLGSGDIKNDINVNYYGTNIRELIDNSEGEEKENYKTLLNKLVDISNDKVKLFGVNEETNCNSSYDSGSGYMSGSGSDSGSGGCSITFERTDYMIDSWDVIKVTSDDYEIDGNTITLADKQTLDLNKINVTNTDKVSLEVNNKKLIVKYEGNEVGSFNIVGGKVITTTSKKNEDSTIKSEVTTSSKTVSTTKKEEEKNIVEKIIDKIFKPTTTKNTENDNQTNVIKESTKKHTTTIEDKSTNVDEEDSQIASIKENTIVGIIVAFVIGVIVCLILIRYNKKQKSN